MIATFQKKLDKFYAKKAYQSTANPGICPQLREPNKDSLDCQKFRENSAFFNVLVVSSVVFKHLANF
jgi:hypothetical protein